MKKFTLLLFFSFFIFHPSFCQGIWTWMSGDSSAESPAVFGIQGVPSVNNHPAATYTPYSWTDLQGNFWLYGGIDVGYADLWKFNPTTLEWTWVKGTAEQNMPPVFGTMGMAADSNTPGSRYLSGCTWVDTSGDLWLFGGGGTTSGYGTAFCDVWKYHIASNEWTWVAGFTLPDRTVSYGRKGVPSVSNEPGSRQNLGSPWVDAFGKVWIYGGFRNNLTTCSDMWMFDPVTNDWTWESGAQGTDSAAVYGTKGIFSSTNTPGVRGSNTMISKNDGNFLLFGGANYGATFADLWEYNPIIEQWAWIGGTKTNDAIAVAGASCQSDSTFYPDARYENATWKDCAGNLWLYGGYSTLNATTFGDVWVYLVASKKWARMAGSANINANPVYGAKGISSLTNQPGARYGAAQWKDKNGNLWVFGGANHSFQIYGDVWRYTPDYNCLNINCSCQPFAGTVSATDDSVCEGTNTITILTVKGSLGHIQWQSGTDGIHFTNLSGDTLNTYTPPPASNQPVYYSVIATDSCGAAQSNTVAIRLLPNPSAGFTYNIVGREMAAFTSDSSSFYALAYHWSFGDDSTGSLANPVHTYDSIKSYTVCLTEYSASNCYNTHCETISGLTGVKNVSSNEAIQLYPNPAGSSITLSINGLIGNYQLKVYNVLGIEVKAIDNLSLHNNQNFSIDLTELAPGAYEVILINGSEYYGGRFVRVK